MFTYVFRTFFLIRARRHHVCIYLYTPDFWLKPETWRRGDDTSHTKAPLALTAQAARMLGRTRQIQARVIAATGVRAEEQLLRAGE